MTDTIYGEKRVNGSKDLYDRVCCWMAGYDEPEGMRDNSFFDLEDGADPKEYLYEEAMNIFYDIYKSCGGIE